MHILHFVHVVRVWHHRRSTETRMLSFLHKAETHAISGYLFYAGERMIPTVSRRPCLLTFLYAYRGACILC
jgi:hypothetical protein